MSSRSDRACAVLSLAAVVLASPARADEAPAEEPRADFMHVLAARGLHELRDEAYNAYGQISLIGHGKAPFTAPYTKSLEPNAEGSWTGSATLYLGAKLWRGGEAYLVPEVISERPLSNLAGLGGSVQNGELQKGGTPAPTIYMSRVVLRQTIGFGGERVEKSSDPMQLGTTVDSRRLVLTIGKFNPLDLLDKNAFAGDIRKQLLNLAFMTHAAYDSATDARGYTWGAVAELYLDSFALRFAHTTVPGRPNDLPIDFRFWKFFGDQVEIEHVHKLFGQRGAVRVLGYRNWQNMGRFDDAVAAHKADPTKTAVSCEAKGLYTYESPEGLVNASAPDLCWVRRPHAKLGIGVNLEQAVTDDLGFFFRGMYSDGQTEVYAYFPADRSISFGALAKGAWWRRPDDSFSVGVGVSWISKAHAEYLNQGGIDGFIGDGKINQAAESLFEVMYSFRVLPPLWFSVDYQHIIHPAYNADRGPVDIGGGRLHAEF
jgi:hypothetical protein